MKTKIRDKKEKKSSVNNTSPLKKPKQQKHAIKSKKGVKKAKLAVSVQNENPTLENNAQVIKMVDKKKWKQNKKVKQQNAITVPSKIKTKDAKEEKNLTTTDSKSDSLSETDTKKLEYLRRRIRRRNGRRKKRQHQHAFDSVASIKLNVEEIKKKMEEIRSREVLSKKARKVLAVLNRKLRFEESANKSDKLHTTVKKNNEKGKHVQTHQQDTLVKNKQINNEDKTKAKKRHGQNKRDKIKAKKNKRNDINVMKDSVDEDESEEDQYNVEKELIDTVEKQIDDKSNEDEIDEEDTNNETNISEARKNKVKNEKKQAAFLEQQEKEKTKKKKKRYVLSVSNLPLNITTNDIRQHFLNKLDIMTNVKMDTTNRLAFVAMANYTDFKKGLLLHDTFFMKKRICVQYGMSNDNEKADVIKMSPATKIKKLQALQKARKLTKNQQNQGKEKPLKQKKHKNSQRHNERDMIN